MFKLRSLLPLLSMLYALPGLANSFTCQLKTQDPALSDVVDKEFTVDDVQGGQGVHGPVTVLLWNLKGRVHLVLKDSSRQLSAQSSYEMGQEEMQLQLSPHLRVTCLSSARAEALKSGAAANAFDADLHPGHDLQEFKQGMALKINKSLIFHYDQKNVSDKMRPIIFQFGKALTADERRDDSRNFCVISARLHVDQDVVMEVGTLARIQDVQVVRGNDRQFVLSYSFIDGSGQAGSKSSQLTLLDLKCSINNETALTYSKFKEITGDRIYLGFKR